MTDPYENTSPEVLEQALELMDDIEAADFDELLQSVADNVTGAEPIPDTLLSDIPRTTPSRVGRTTSRSQSCTSFRIYTFRNKTWKIQKDASLQSTPHPKTKHSETIRRHGVTSRS